MQLFQKKKKCQIDILQTLLDLVLVGIIQYNDRGKFNTMFLSFEF